jgi:hypothetical protein
MSKEREERSLKSIQVASIRPRGRSYIWAYHSTAGSYNMYLSRYSIHNMPTVQYGIGPLRLGDDRLGRAARGQVINT